MRDLSSLKFHPTSESLVEVLCDRTQNRNPLFFRVQVAYYFAKIASMMRTVIDTKDRGIIPVNVYAINLATSGQGKGQSTNIIEESVINQFKEVFLQETFPIVAKRNLAKLATERALRKNTVNPSAMVTPDDELLACESEFKQLGALAFSFDSATTAAVKQMRLKLLMADAGSMNMEIDEIGSNLLGQIDVLNTFLELYDVGKVKQKLTKNTNESVRSEEIDGKTPTNMLLYGTPSKLLNGAKVEEEFYSMLETGYARRSIFGFAKSAVRDLTLTPDQIYDMLTDTTKDQFVSDLSDELALLADPIHFNTKLRISKDVTLQLIEYRTHCEKLASTYPDHDEIRKSEMAHRYFKSLKIAGTYAFIDGSPEVTEDHLYYAIALVEESGKAFEQLLSREQPYVKLAKYIAAANRELTGVDLVENLPFYKGTESAKRELMTLAIAYGYKNNIIIKKFFNDGIEFLKGESLKETNLDEMVISYGTELATGYLNERVPFDKMHNLIQQPNYHWVNHHLLGGHRLEVNCIPEFNMVVFDIDNGTSMDTAKMLLKDYKALYYTTKSHEPHKHRFRIIMPISYHLKLDSDDYKEFMNNLYEWLPIKGDDSTNQRSRKWRTNKGMYEYVDGSILDPLPFIPKTAKNEARRKVIDSQQSMDNLERWFVNNTGMGNRSNQLIKFALLLVDSGMDFDVVTTKVINLNSKLADKMDEAEIHQTILASAYKAIAKRESK